MAESPTAMHFKELTHVNVGHHIPAVPQQVLEIIASSNTELAKLMSTVEGVDILDLHAPPEFDGNLADEATARASAASWTQFHNALQKQINVISCISSIRTDAIAEVKEQMANLYNGPCSEVASENEVHLFSLLANTTSLRVLIGCTDVVLCTVWGKDKYLQEVANKPYDIYALDREEVASKWEAVFKKDAALCEAAGKLSRAELERLKSLVQGQQLRIELFLAYQDQQPNNIFDAGGARPATMAELTRVKGDVSALQRENAVLKRTLAEVQGFATNALSVAEQARTDNAAHHQQLATLANVTRETTAQQAAQQAAVTAFQQAPAQLPPPAFGMQGPNPQLAGFFPPGGAFPGNHFQPNHALAQLDQLSNELNGGPGKKQKKFNPGHPAFGKTPEERKAHWEAQHAAKAKPAKQHGGRGGY